MDPVTAALIAVGTIVGTIGLVGVCYCKCRKKIVTEEVDRGQTIQIENIEEKSPIAPEEFKNNEHYDIEAPLIHDKALSIKPQLFATKVTTTYTVHSKDSHKNAQEVFSMVHGDSKAIDALGAMGSKALDALSPSSLASDIIGGVTSTFKELNNGKKPSDNKSVSDHEEISDSSRYTHSKKHESFHSNPAPPLPHHDKQSLENSTLSVPSGHHLPTPPASPFSVIINLTSPESTGAARQTHHRFYPSDSPIKDRGKLGAIAEHDSYDTLEELYSHSPILASDSASYSSHSRMDSLRSGSSSNTNNSKPEHRVENEIVNKRLQNELLRTEVDSLKVQAEMVEAKLKLDEVRRHGSPNSTSSYTQEKHVTSTIVVTTASLVSELTVPEDPSTPPPSPHMRPLLMQRKLSVHSIGSVSSNSSAGRDCESSSYQHGKLGSFVEAIAQQPPSPLIIPISPRTTVAIHGQTFKHHIGDKPHHLPDPLDLPPAMHCRSGHTDDLKLAGAAPSVYDDTSY